MTETLPGGRRHQLRVAAWLGRCVDGDVAANLAAARRAIGAAGEQKVDFLCLPEAFLSGYGSREIVERGALALDDPRLGELAGEAAERGLVLLIGLSERLESGEIGHHPADGREAIANTVAIYADGARLGIYRKTMLTGSDAREMGYCRDFELPVFQAREITFGCIICHDSSFVEPAATLAYRGAQVIFSPHYNALPAEAMDEHRIRVRNNHIGLAALLGVFVVRANVVGQNSIRPGTLGYGDSAIFDPRGVPIAEAGLFREALIVADIDPDAALRSGAARREELPARVRQQLADALCGCESRNRPRQRGTL